MRPGRAPRSQTGRLPSLEVAVDEFAATLNSAKLIRALRDGEPERFDRLPALLLRSGLVRTRVAGCDESRAVALSILRAGVAQLGGSNRLEELDRALQTIETAERGYHALGLALERLLLRHPPEFWLWAVLDESCALLEWAMKEVDFRAAAMSRIDGSTFALPDGSGGEYPAEELIAMVDATTSMCVRTLAARNKWISADGAIVLPGRVPFQTEAPDSSALRRLGELWDLWRRMETGARFLDGRLDEMPVDDGPLRFLSPSAEDMQWRRIAHVAHEQLSIEIMSVFNQLVYREDAHRAAVGIHGTAPLMPGALVNATEVHAYYALEAILAAEPVADTRQYLGLTLVEWIRGYSVLAELAEEAAQTSGGSERLYIRLSDQTLAAMLGRLGLARGKADRFIANVTFGRNSIDVVDEPIFRLEDGNLLLFGPTAINCEVARTLLSKLARHNLQIGGRGKRFERWLREHLSDWGLRTLHGTFRSEGETYEIDAAFRLDRRLFLLECKSRSAFGVDPASVWRLRQWMSGTAAQARRIALGIATAPQKASAALGEDVQGLEVVPCIVGAIPLQVAGTFDGVYFTDQMALANFFVIGEAGVYATHRIPGLPPVRETVFAIPLRAGSTPSSDDLVQFLDNPPSVAMVEAHLRNVEIREKEPGVGEFRTTEIERVPDSVQLSVAALREMSAAPIATYSFSSLHEHLRR